MLVIMEDLSIMECNRFWFKRKSANKKRRNVPSIAYNETGKTVAMALKYFFVTRFFYVISETQGVYFMFLS